MSAELKGNIIKLILALFKHQLELWLGKEFVELAAEPLAEIGGEKLEEFLKGIDGPKELIAAGKLADTLFRSRCQDRALLDVLSMDFGDQAAIQSAIKELPVAMDSDIVKASIRDMFQRDFSSVLTSHQITNGAELYTDCLLEALVPLEQHALPAIGELVRETLGQVRLLRQEQAEEFGYVKNELREIKSRITPIQIGVHSAFLVPFPHNEKFVGRDDDLDKLHAALISGSTVGVRPAMLSGMGGIGKTQLAVEYAYRHRNDYSGGVYWINAAEDWISELTRLAEQTGFHSEEENENRRREALSNSFVNFIQKTPDTLMIFDNVEDPRRLRQPLENINVIPSELPRLLFTTRRRDRDLPFQSIEVRVLPLDAAVHLLLDSDARRAVLDLPENDLQRQIAHAICRDLGGLPLALALASAYLGRHRSITLDGYKKRLAKEGLSAVDSNGVDSMDLPTRHDAAVAATLKSQWDVLENEDARLALWTASLLSEAAVIPRPRLSLLTGLLDQASEGYPNAFEAALTELQALCLIEELGSTDIRLHPLVREFVYSTIPDLDSFTVACYERLESALWDMKRLNAEIDSRGVDTVIADMHVAIELAHMLKLKNESNIIGKLDLPGLSSTLDREAHHLRKPVHDIQPSYVLQQIYRRALNRSETTLRERSESELSNSHLPWLKELFVSDHESKAHIRTFEGHSSASWGVCIMPDGKYALSSSMDKTLRLWDIQTGQTIRIFQGHSEVVYNVDITSDGKQAISASGDKTLRLWDIQTGQTIRIFTGHSNSVNCVSFTPDNKYIISSSSDKTVRLWNVQSGQLLRTFNGHTDTIWNVKITFDGRYAVSASLDKTMRLWDIQTGQSIRTFKGHTAFVTSVCITPDGKYALSSSMDKTLRLWDMQTGQTIRIFQGHSDNVNSVSITSDGKYAISASKDNTLRLWDIQTGQPISIFEGHSIAVVNVRITPDDNYFISASLDNNLRLWNIQSGQPIHELEGHSSRVVSVDLTPQGNHAISASFDYTLRLWDVQSGQAIRTFEGHSNLVYSVSITPDGKYVISASADHTLHLWNIQTGETVRIFKGHTSSVQDVRITPDGKYVISASSDGTLRLWDIQTGQTIRIFKGHTDRVLSVYVTAKGKQALSGSADHTLRLWDIQTGKTIRTFEGHINTVDSVRATSDGKYAISASADHTLRLWDIQTGQMVSTFEGHFSFVNMVSITSNDKYAISASADHTLRLWDIKTGKCKLILAGNAPFESVCVYPNNKYIIAGDAAGAVHFIEIFHLENLT